MILVVVLLVSLADGPNYYLGGGEWVLYATHIYYETTDLAELLCIDPQTGAHTTLMTLSRQYSGLAQGYDGTLYAIHKNQGLYTINPFSGTETFEGSHGYGKIEALEFAFGDVGPAVDLEPLVPSSWTSSGALFSFDDTSDSFLITNPANGNSMAYECAFQTIDCEGLVFFTITTDPLIQALANTYD